MSTTAAPTTGKSPTPRSAAAPNGSGGDLPWWEYRTVRQQLAAFGAGLAGRHRFSMSFARTGVNYTDFTRRQVVIDPQVLVDPDPAVHLALTKGAICHEEGHVVFTTPFYGMDTSRMDIKDQIVARVANVLEDERIDRAMMDRHWGTEKYLRFRKRRMWDDNLPALDPASDDPTEVINAIIHMRYGWRIKGSLSPLNQQRYEQVWPLVLRGWNGISTEVVRVCAEEIVRILGLEQAAREQMEKVPQSGCRVALIGRRSDAADDGPGGMGVPSVSIRGLRGSAGKSGKGGQGDGDDAGKASSAGGGGDGESGGGDDPDGDGAGAKDRAAGDGAKAGGEGADGTGADGDAAGAGARGADAQDGEDAGDGDADGDAEGDAAGAKGDKDAQDGQEDGQDAGGGADDEGDGLILVLMDDEEVEDLLDGEGEQLARVFAGVGGTETRHDPLRPRAIPDGEWDAARRRAQVLSHHLRRIPPRPRSQAVEVGPRYSFRDEVRHPDRSFRKRDVPTRQRTVAIGVLVDCSGSMGAMMPQVRAAVLSLHEAAREVEVPVAVWGFSSWAKPTVPIIRFGDNPTLAPERIGGLEASGGTILAPALAEAHAALREQRADRRVMIVIHDGWPADMAASSTEIRRMRREVEVVGVLLGDDGAPETSRPMREMFADRLITSKDADGLMTVLGTFLARLLTPAAA